MSAESAYPNREPHKSWTPNYLALGALVLLALWVAVSRFAALPHPPIGTFIGVLAFVAAVVTLWPPDNAWAKAGWLLAFGGFFFLEISTLYKQRAEDADTAKNNRITEDNRFADLLSRQQDSFAQVLQKSQQEFVATMRRSASILKKTEVAESFASGGTSFPLIWPYIVTQDSGVKEIGFSLSDQGKYPLYGLVVNVGRPYQTSPTSTFLVGTVFRSDEYNYLNTPLLFQALPAEDDVYYSASMWARNGKWAEVMEARRVRDKFAFRWVLYASERGETPHKLILDLADDDFPASERHKPIYPLNIRALPVMQISK